MMQFSSFFFLLWLFAATNTANAQLSYYPRRNGGNTGGTWCSCSTSPDDSIPSSGWGTYEDCMCIGCGVGDDCPSHYYAFLGVKQRPLPDGSLGDTRCACQQVSPAEARDYQREKIHKTHEECECTGCGPVDPSFCPAEKPPPSDSVTGSSSGDPHFKTWTGDKFDYHGECDLVLVDSPSFDNRKGLRVHIRTTRVKYFSYIEKIGIKIGTDVLEFANDVQGFLINGKPVEKQRKHHTTYLDRFVVRRDKKAISIRLSDRKQKGPKIDLIQRNIGFPAVIVDAGDDTTMFEGSLGLLGQWKTGKKMARDNNTEIALGDDGKDATAFALEWQVRDDEPMLFSEARFPQYPATCTPPAKQALANRLGSMLAQEKAAKACASWGEDKEDCIFDVIATRDVMVAEEGSIIVDAE